MAFSWLRGGGDLKKIDFKWWVGPIPCYRGDSSFLERFLWLKTKRGNFASIYSCAWSSVDAKNAHQVWIKRRNIYGKGKCTIWESTCREAHVDSIFPRTMQMPCIRRPFPDKKSGARYYSVAFQKKVCHRDRKPASARSIDHKSLPQKFMREQT